MGIVCDFCTKGWRKEGKQVEIEKTNTNRIRKKRRGQGKMCVWRT